MQCEYRSVTLPVTAGFPAVAGMSSAEAETIKPASHHATADTVPCGTHNSLIQWSSMDAKEACEGRSSAGGSASYAV